MPWAACSSRSHCSGAIRTCLCKAFSLGSAIVSCRPPSRFRPRTGASFALSYGLARQSERRQDALGGPVSRECVPGSGRPGRSLSPYGAAVASTYRCSAGKSIEYAVLRPAHDRCSKRQGRDRAARSRRRRATFEHRSVASISGTPGARRTAQDQQDDQPIAGIGSHGKASINDAWGVRTNRRRGSPTRFLAAQVLVR